jgi:divalent metal cation (Fe/Co/Zn/Cd) transporter
MKCFGGRFPYEEERLNKDTRYTPAAGLKVEYLSLAWMFIEAAGSLIAGVMASSVALEAFGLDSIIEIAAGLVLVRRLKVELSGLSRDKVRRYEKASSWVVGVCLLLLAAYVVVSSGVSLYSRKATEPSVLGLVIVGVSSVLMPYLALLKRRIGRSIGSKALEADGFCSMVCAYMSWSVLAGVLATIAFGWWWVDSAAAMGIVYFIVREGLEAIEAARSEGDEACGCCGGGEVREHP